MQELAWCACMGILGVRGSPLIFMYDVDPCYLIYNVVEDTISRMLLFHPGIQRLWLGSPIAYV